MTPEQLTQLAAEEAKKYLVEHCTRGILSLKRIEEQTEHAAHMRAYTAGFLRRDEMLKGEIAERERKARAETFGWLALQYERAANLAEDPKRAKEHRDNADFLCQKVKDALAAQEGDEGEK